MKKNFHVKVAKTLARKLNLSKDYERILVKAIVKPDGLRRKNPRNRHHRLNYYTIVDHVVSARIYYIHPEG